MFLTSLTFIVLSKSMKPGNTTNALIMTIAYTFIT